MTNGFATHVRARDGQEIGAIDRLILDAAGNKVKAAVIRKGRLLRRDVEVPLSLLRRSSSGDLHLDLNSDEVEQLPPFDEAAYVNPPAGYIAPAGYPGENFYLPRSAVADPSTEKRAPRGALSAEEFDRARIHEGSLVLARDGKYVGNVRETWFDPESGRLTALIIRTDSWTKKECELAAPMIAGLRDGVVYLRIDAYRLLPGTPRY
jgi:uncharacterized protein YrrD